MINRLAISSAVLVATVFLAGWIALGKTLVLLAGYDQAVFELTGELVPVWPVRIQVIAAVELIIAVAMGGLAAVGLSGRLRALPLLPYFALAFTLAEVSELISYLLEVGIQPFPTVMLVKIAIWSGWLVINVVLFRKREDAGINPSP
jgi:hypothetical protein